MQFLKHVMNSIDRLIKYLMRNVRVAVEHKLRAISLIEVSFSLIIMGVLLTAALQGWKWMEKAKLHNVTQQIMQIKVANENMRTMNIYVNDTDKYFEILYKYGGPKNSEGIIKTGIGGGFVCERVSPAEMSLSALSENQANQIKQSVDPSEDGGWVTIQQDLDEKYKLYIVL